MFTDKILVANIVYRAEQMLKEDKYEPIGAHLGYIWSTNGHPGEMHYFDREETRRSISLYISHLKRLSKVLGMLDLCRWSSEEDKEHFDKWACAVWENELPFVIPRMRLYNKEDPKRNMEIYRFLGWIK